MRLLRIAAAYEILAGLIGLAFVFHPQQLPNGSAVNFNIYALALACVSIILGLRLWTGNALARRASLGFQLLQIPRISSTAFILSVLVGIEGTIRFQGPLASLFTTMGVTLFALMPYTPQPTVVGLNLVAAIVAVVVWQGRREVGSLRRGDSEAAGRNATIESAAG